MHPAAAFDDNDDFTLLRLTSQCPGIARDIQRLPPINTHVVKAATASVSQIDSALVGTKGKGSFMVQQFNTENGASGQKGEDLLSWLKSKSKSIIDSSNIINLGLAVAGFCELNGWQVNLVIYLCISCL